MSAFVFGFIFLSVAVLLALSFFNPKSNIKHANKTISHSTASVWQAIYNKELYLKSKKEITRYHIYDSISPKWVEYYTPNDSIENRTTSYTEKSRLTYASMNRKYQQVNAFSYRIDSLAPQRTRVTISEYSRYFNLWGSLYFQLFRPNTVLEYEFVKLENTLTYLDSLYR